MFRYHIVEQRLNRLSFVQKLQLYSIPVLIVVLVHILFVPQILPQAPQQKRSHTPKKSLNHHRNIDFIHTIKQIEFYANNFQVTIDSIHNKNQKNIHLRFYGGYLAIVQFIHKIEQLHAMIGISTLSLQAQEKSLHVDALLSVGESFFSNIQTSTYDDISALRNPFYNSTTQKSHTQNKSTPKKLKLYGIIGDFAQINETLVQKGEDFENYTLTTISQDSITLQNKNETLILKVLHDE